MEKVVFKNRFSKIVSWVLIAALVFTAVMPAAGSAYAAEESTNVEWYNFRNNQENNGVTDKNTPTTLAETYLKWAVKYGSGWSAAPTPPIIVDGKIYTGVGNVILELDKETGEVIRQSDPMVANVGYAMNPLLYADGKIFAQVGNGIIQAVDIETMTTSWNTEKIGGQTVSPISYVEIDGTGYIYTGTWSGESRDGVFFCVTTDDSNVTDGIKAAEWTFMPSGNQEGAKYDPELKATLEDEGNVAKRGFYWAGAYANENYIAVGSDDGTSEGDYSANAVFYTLNPKTGDIIDRIEGIKGDIRTTTVYDNGYLYFSTKGGHLYKVPVDANGNMGEATYIDLGGMTTASPVVYKNKIYIGVCGQGGQFDADGGHGFAVVDNSTKNLSTDSLMYKIPIKGYPQAAALVSTAHVEEDFDGNGEADGRVYIYFTYNAYPGGIYYTYDTADQTNVAEISQELFVPESSLQQYCISTICTDNEGTLYYKNDSCYLMAVERNESYLEDIQVTADDGSEVQWNQDFDPGTGEYNLVVKGSAKELTIDAVSVEGADSLYFDDKTINMEDKIAVTTSVIVKKNDKTREYTLNIRKEGTESALSALKVNTSNAYSQAALSFTSEFAYDNYEYSVDVSELSRNFYNIWPDAADVNAVVEVTAVENVKNKAAGEAIAVTASNSGHNRYAIYPADTAKTAVVDIKVTSEDGATSNTYRVNLVKKYYFASVTAADQDYTGELVEPAVTVLNGLGETVDPAEYTVTYANNIEVGEAAVTVTGNADSKYEGCTETATFNICKKALGTIEVSDQFYTGNALTPAFNVLAESGQVIDPSQYTLTYENNIEVGEATVTATPVEGSLYEGTISAQFTIRKKNIAEITLRNGEVYAYTGGEVTPAITVKDENGSTVSSSKYTVTYNNNVNVGTAQLTVTANEDSLYTGSATVDFNILQGKLSYYSADTKAYTGDPIVSGIVIKDNNWKTVPKSAYNIEFKNNIDVGTASFVATAKEGSGYFGEVSGTFKIEKARITEVNVENQYYTGSEIEPDVEVMDNYGNVVPSSEYTVAYSDNVEVGLANVTVKANYGSNYRGTLYGHFIIGKRTLDSATLSASKVNYTGSAIKPTVKVYAGGKLLDSSSYTVSYKNNTKVGKATVTITGKGNYTGSVTKTFMIVPKAPTSAKAVLYGRDDVKFSWDKVSNASGYFVYYKKSTSTEYTYLTRTTGTSVKKADLTDGIKYYFKVVPYYKYGDTRYASLSYKTASVTTLKEPAAPTSASAVLYGHDDVKFSWSKVSGASGYSVYYKKSTSDSYTLLTRTTGTSVKKANLTDGAKYYFKVVPYVKSGDNRFESTKYKTASVTTLKEPAAPTSASAVLYGHDDVKFSWSKVSGASGYSVYYKKSTSDSYTLLTRTTGTSVKKANLTDGAKYYFKVVPYVKSGDNRFESTKYKTASVTTLKELPKPTVVKSGTKVKVSWKNIDGESGYQYQQLVLKSGKYVSVTRKHITGTSVTLSATKNKTYYYRVRAYKTVNGTKIYGPWSDKKAYTRK